MNKQEILEKLNSESYSFLKENKNLGDNIILLVIAGSHAYGLDTEDSDLDIRGIAMETDDVLYGMNSFDLYEDKKTDTVIYSLKKFMGLAMKGSPNILELLYTRPSDILYISEEGKRLLENRELFLSKAIYRTVRGFAKHSLQRIKKQTDPKKINKGAMHLIRLYLSGIKALNTKNMPVYQDSNIKMLKEIRYGKYMNDCGTLNDEFLNTVDNYETWLTAACDKSSLPDKVDKDKLSELQKNLYYLKQNKKNVRQLIIRYRTRQHVSSQILDEEAAIVRDLARMLNGYSIQYSIESDDLTTTNQELEAE